MSWISTRGKCRYCHVPIGWFEPVIELGVALFFIGSYLLWPVSLESTLSIVQFALWLVGGLLLAILFVYDLRWFLLPNLVMFPLIAAAAVFAILKILSASDSAAAVVSLTFAVVILSGIYLLMWIVSKGKWIGFGDVKLGLALALFLADWQLAFVALFAANLIGCLLVLPGLVTGKLSRSARIPFGPLLIVGGILAILVGRQVVDWYTTILL